MVLKNLSYDRKKYYYVVLFLFINFPILIDIIRLLSDLYQLSFLNINTIRNVMYLCPALYVYGLIFTNPIKKKTFKFIVGIVLIFIYSLIINTWILSYLTNDLLIFFLRVCVGLFLFRFATDYHKIIDLQRFILIPTLVFAILFMASGYTENYMGYSYTLMLPSIFIFIYGYSYKKYLYIFVGCIALFSILIFGARGAFAFGVFSISTYILFTTRLTVKKMILVSTAVILLMLVCLNMKTIIDYLYTIYGSSRTLRMMLNGFAFDAGGRAIRQEAVLESMSILPQGLFSDRKVISQAVGTAINSDYYPHNIFLEILFQFGFIIGLIVCALIILLLINTFIAVIREKIEYKILYFSCVVPFVLQSMVSGSYLTNYVSGIALGICLNMINLKNIGFFRRRIKINAR